MSHRYMKIRSCNVCPMLKNNSYALPYCNQPGKLPVLILKDLSSIPADCPLETEYDICTRIKNTFADQLLEYLIPKREPMSRLSPAALGVLDGTINMIKQLKEVQ